MFDLFDLTEKTDEDALFDLCYAPLNEKTNVFDNLLLYAKEFLGAQTVLVEHEYIDMDFRNEYSSLYSKAFKQYTNKCMRLHFFAKRIKDIEFIKNISLSLYTLKYLGYVVVRPVTVGKVGRTVLSAQHKKLDPERDYVLCTDLFTSHLFGKTFEIKGAPFIQQDSMVMTCAQASIWMAARYMHQKFGFPCHLPCHITESASASLGWAGRTLPSEGLTVYMMLNALNNMGYSPIFSLKPSLHEYVGKENKYEKALDNWNDIGNMSRPS